MSLHLNLLHEEISEARQRKRDPLKLGMMALGAVGSVMVLWYCWNAYRTLELKSRLSAVQRDWAKVEPEVTTAKKRSEELTKIINTTKVLDKMIDERFYWAPFLEKLARCVAPNTQLNTLEGGIVEDGHEAGVHVQVNGLAAGREPRAAAEDLRQLLLEQLSQSYSDVKVEFKTLDDLDTIVNVGGANMAMANYTLSIKFQPRPAGKSDDHAAHGH